MSSYNYILNNFPTYKKELIYSLITGGSFPEHIPTPEIRSEDTIVAQHDPLFAFFLTRKFNKLEDIIHLQEAKFGGLDSDLFWSVIFHIKREIEDKKTSPLVGELLARADKNPKVMPTSSQFQQWREFHQEYFQEVIAFVRNSSSSQTKIYTPRDLFILFDGVLKWNGMYAHGWRVQINDRTNFISVAKNSRCLLIGPSAVRLGQNRLIGLVIHEVYIHIMWCEFYQTKRLDLSQEEGMGTFVEQLSLQTFQLLKMYRFLGIYLALGVDGNKRDMRQTYSVLLELRRALKPLEASEVSEQIIAKEVVRIFRNLPPDIPGLVYLRDKNYMEQNISLWDTLSTGKPSLKRYISLVAPWRNES